MINYFPVKCSFLDVYVRIMCLCVCPWMQCKIFFIMGYSQRHLKVISMEATLHWAAYECGHHSGGLVLPCR